MQRRSLLPLACLMAAFLISLAAPAWAAEIDLGVITVKQKAQAESLRQRLAKGESFETLAKEFSVGPAANRGGRLGRVPDTRLRAEYRQALKDLKAGQPSQVIPTEEGYSVLMRFDQPSAAAAPAAAAAAGPAPQAAAAAPQTQAAAAASAAPGRATSAPESSQLQARQRIMRGLESWAQGNLKAAEASFSAALGLNPREDAAAFLLDVARKVAAGKFNAKAGQAFAQGFLAFLEPNLTEALAGFAQARAADPNFWPALLFQANVLAGQGKAAEARALLQQVLAIEPKNSRARLTLGLMAQDERNIEEAQAQYKKALEAEPDLAEAHYRLASLALAQGQYGEAESRLQAALAQDPYKDEAYNDLGLLYSLTNRGAQAEQAYQKALELNPEQPPAHVNLGVLYARGGKINAAIDEFNKALALEPRMGDAHVNLAAALIMKEDWEQAVFHADTALRLGAQVPEVILQKLAPHRRK